MVELLAKGVHDSRWYAVRTLSNHEHKAKKELLHRAFEVFLPSYKTWSKRKDRRKQILLPLFPGYLFVYTKLAEERRIDILRSYGVVNILGSRSGPVPIPDHEVNSIQTLLKHGGDPTPSPVIKGQLVKIMEGPLSGVVGVVERSAGRKIIVSIELVGRAVSATLYTDSFSMFPIICPVDNDSKPLL